MFMGFAGWWEQQCTPKKQVPPALRCPSQPAFSCSLIFNGALCHPAQLRIISRPRKRRVVALISQKVFIQVVLPKSIPAQICQLIL